MPLDYRRKPLEQQRRLTRVEFIVVVSGAAVLAAILSAAAWFYVSLAPDW